MENKKTAEKEKKKKKPVEKEILETVAERPVSDPYDVIKFVLMTERSIQIIETQNKLSFIVDRKAKKHDIKRAAEGAFKTPVKSVNTLIDQAGRKRAIVRFTKDGIAGEIAIRLGII
ncbi:MAG: 50S ribosomal protein L23 [Candidatus Aenigmatarchaeota archaeon]